MSPPLVGVEHGGGRSPWHAHVEVLTALVAANLDRHCVAGRGMTEARAGANVPELPVDVITHRCHAATSLID